MRCCTRILDLGCFDSCDTIELPFNYTQTGEYTVLYETSFIYKSDQDGVTDDPIQIDLSKLLESAEYIIRIINPDGTRYSYQSDGVTYNCFKLQTYIATSV